MGKRKRRTQGRGGVLLRGILAGAGTILLLVILLALSVYWGWLSESAVSIVNTIIKIAAAIAAGVTIGLSRKHAPWYFGGIAAVASMAITTAVMSLYLGSFGFSWNLLADYLMTFAIGSAAAAALSRRKEQ